MRHRARATGRQAARRISGREIRELRERVQELEDEVQECRQLNLRLAELTDVVQELLLPMSLRDEAKIAELMERYSKSL